MGSLKSGEMVDASFELHSVMLDIGVCVSSKHRICKKKTVWQEGDE